MKNLKPVLAVLMAVCLMMCLAVPAFATTGDSASFEENMPLSATDAAGAEGTNPESATEPESDEGTNPESATEGTEEPLPTEEDVAVEATETEEDGGVLYTILLILEVIASVLLIIVVLVQSGKEAGLSGALSGNSDSYMSKSGKGGLDKKLASATKWVALVWIVITLLLGLVK